MSDKLSCYDLYIVDENMRTKSFIKTFHNKEDIVEHLKCEFEGIKKEIMDEESWDDNELYFSEVYCIEKREI